MYLQQRYVHRSTQFIWIREKKQHTMFRLHATLQQCNLNKYCPKNITMNNANQTNIGQTKELNMHVFENKTT